MTDTEKLRGNIINICEAIILLTKKVKNLQIEIEVVKRVQDTYQKGMYKDRRDS